MLILAVVWESSLFVEVRYPKRFLESPWQFQTGFPINRLWMFKWHVWMHCGDECWVIKVGSLSSKRLSWSSCTINWLHCPRFGDQWVDRVFPPDSWYHCTWGVDVNPLVIWKGVTRMALELQWYVIMIYWFPLWERIGDFLVSSMHIFIDVMDADMQFLWLCGWFFRCRGWVNMCLVIWLSFLFIAHPV